MALNMQLLQQSVRAYGAPLYGQEPSSFIGTIDHAGQHPVIDGSLVITDGDQTMYVPVRRSVLESADFNAETHMFNIGVFTALRDADGEYNGKAWSIKAGETKTFAY